MDKIRSHLDGEHATKQGKEIVKAHQEIAAIIKCFESRSKNSNDDKGAENCTVFFYSHMQLQQQTVYSSENPHKQSPTNPTGHGETIAVRGLKHQWVVLQILLIQMIMHHYINVLINICTK